VAGRELPIFCGTLPEYRGKEVLSRLGIPVPDGGLARSFEEAIGIARDIGFPVALKAQAATLAHKSDVGGVVLDLADEASLHEGWETLHQNLAARAPGIILEGILVERMAQKGIELIFGARNDPQWGPVLLAGFGGVLAEAMHDTRLLPTGLPLEQIIEELFQLRCASLLRGFRGSPSLDVQAAAEILSALGRLMLSAPEIQEIDINPVVVYPQGSGAMALDAVIVGRQTNAAPSLGARRNP
jgi:acyl-CoA synthetase (NDP forming)